MSRMTRIALCCFRGLSNVDSMIPMSIWSCWRHPAAVVLVSFEILWVFPRCSTPMVDVLLHFSTRVHPFLAHVSWLIPLMTAVAPVTKQVGFMGWSSKYCNLPSQYTRSSMFVYPTLLSIPISIYLSQWNKMCSSPFSLTKSNLWRTCTISWNAQKDVRRIIVNVVNFVNHRGSSTHL